MDAGAADVVERNPAEDYGDDATTQVALAMVPRLAPEPKPMKNRHTKHATRMKLDSINETGHPDHGICARQRATWM